MSEQTKDYSLLRPFDLEKAKAGEPICAAGGEESRLVYHEPNVDYHSVVGIFSQGRIYCTCEEGRINGRGCIDFFMVPLCWVEGKPVYKGDVLYRPEFGRAKYTASYLITDKDGDCFLSFADGRGSSWVSGPSNMGVDCTWNQPEAEPEAPRMVKRSGWMNCYPSNANASAYTVWRCKQLADNAAQDGRTACVFVEWEEPAGKEGGE